MILSTVYVMCKNMKKSLDFYSSFFEEGPVQFNDDRWATFNSGVSLFSPSYDERLLNEGKRGCFNDAYIQQFLKEKTVRPGNSVVFNFYVDDLKKEYERLKKLNIGELSDLMFVNVHSPYWYFNIYDPDGNVLEITGNYSNE